MKKSINKVNLIIIICIMIINVGCSKKDYLDNTSNTLNIDNNLTPIETEEVSEYSSGNFHIESQEVKRTFEEAIEISDCAVDAEYISFYDKGDYIEYEFKVNELLFGDIPDTNFYLFALKGTSHIEGSTLSYKSANNKYISGNNYILIMQKDESFFYDNNVRYRLLSNIFISLDNINESTMYGKPIYENAEDILNNHEDISQYIKYVKASTNKSLSATSDKSPFVKSNNLNTIVEESDLILELLIEDIENEAPFHNGANYICNIVSVIKGDVVENVGDNVSVLLLKDSVELGNKYIIMLNKLGINDYLQSSKNSIISVEDGNLVDKINTYIN